MHFDSAGMELSFTGNSTTVTSFTIGYFLYAPHFTGTFYQTMWTILPAHGNFTASASHFDWRLTTAHWKENYLSYMNYFDGIIGRNYWTAWDSSKWTGWFHVAFTYEKKTNLISEYIDGTLKANWTAPIPWTVKGTSGGCVFF